MSEKSDKIFVSIVLVVILVSIYMLADNTRLVVTILIVLMIVNLAMTWKINESLKDILIKK